MCSSTLFAVFTSPDVMDLRCALIFRSLVKALELSFLYINIGVADSQQVLDGLVEAQLSHYIRVCVLGR